MPSIYAIRDDESLFQQLDLEVFDLLSYVPNHLELEDVSEFHLRNTAMSAWWPQLNVQFEPRPANPDGNIPDLSCWNDATLVLSPKAYNLLKDPLAVYGEFLPIDVNDETFYIFNCLEIGDVKKDSIQYDYEGNTKLGVNNFQFEASVDQKLVFKTPVESCLTLYCNTVFSQFVNQHELSGLHFDEELVVQSPFDSE